MKNPKKILPKVCKHCSAEQFLTEFTLESDANTTRGLIIMRPREA